MRATECGGLDTFIIPYLSHSFNLHDIISSSNTYNNIYNWSQNSIVENVQTHDGKVK